MHAVAAADVESSARVDLDTVRNTSISDVKEPPVRQNTLFDNGERLDAAWTCDVHLRAAPRREAAIRNVERALVGREREAVRPRKAVGDRCGPSRLGIDAPNPVAERPIRHEALACRTRDSATRK